MDRKEVYAIIVLHWALFAFILFAAWLVMDTRNLNKELEYMQHYRDSINSAALQDIMCNGTPAV